MLTEIQNMVDFFLHYGAQVAQLVEQGTENPRVGSSTLSLGTIFVSELRINRVQGRVEGG